MYQFAKKEKMSGKKEYAIQRKAPQKVNRTGIPTQLKERIEGGTGMSLDDVRVHYNSDRPAKLDALAYTQGNRVEIAPGQERHLAHELGHVVQQKLGVVRANARHASGVSLNTDMALERQADEIGAGKKVETVQRKEDNVVQRMRPAGSTPQGGGLVPPGGGPVPQGGGLVPPAGAGAGGAQALDALDQHLMGLGDIPAAINEYMAHRNVYRNQTYYNQTYGTIIWPQNDGFSNNPTIISLPSNTQVDRYGYDAGRFVSPLGVSYRERSLAPGTDQKPYNKFRVVNTIYNVQSGYAAPWFGEPGGGEQYKLPDTVANLLQSKNLERK